MGPHCIVSGARIKSPLGDILLAATAAGLCGLWFREQKYAPDTSAWPRMRRDALIDQAEAELSEYFGGQRSHFEVPIDWASGTDFQRSVWKALLGIPAGHTATYSQIAERVSRPSSVRAVASAIGRNPVSIIVPCHRVLGANGTLTGYAGGLERKAALLSLEGARQ